jgi:NurA-like 5'-3' nuclease
MKNRYSFEYSSIKPPLTEGQTIEYWMEAEDGNNVTGPGITDSEHHTIKIVSELEKKSDVMNRWVDELSVIKEVSETQSSVNHDLGEIIQAKPESK